MGVAHAGTIIANIGSGSTVGKLIMVETEVGARTTTGGAQSTKSFSSTDETCNIGDLIKYINVNMQIAPRVSGGTDANGWLEFAVVAKREADADVPNTQIGNLTLGNIAKNMYRNECIWTGFIPCGDSMPNGVQLHIKVPKAKQYLKIGDTIVLFYYWRSNLSTSVLTDSNRFIGSYMYKAYS